MKNKRFQFHKENKKEEKQNLLPLLLHSIPTQILLQFLFKVK